MHGAVYDGFYVCVRTSVFLAFGPRKTFAIKCPFGGSVRLYASQRWQQSNNKTRACSYICNTYVRLYT